MKLLQKLEAHNLGKIPGRDLLVPVDRDFMEYRKAHPHKGEHAVGIMQDNAILTAYLKKAHVRCLRADTNVPLGILMMLYNRYLPAEAPRLQHALGGRAGEGPLDVEQLLPFGVVLGMDVRTEVCDMMNQTHGRRVARSSSASQ